MERKIDRDSGNQDVPIRTPRNKIHFANRRIVGNHPLLFLSQGKKKDFLTPEELIGGLYGKRVTRIKYNLSTIRF